MLEILGYISGVLMFLSIVPYIRDILLLKTQPQRTSWFIWLVLSSISFLSQLVKGGTWSLLFTAGNILGLFCIFILSFKYGVGGYKKRDVVALIGAGMSLLLWYFTKEPAAALLLVILIDFSGALLTIVKSYENPKSETLSTWIISVVGALLGALAVGKIDLILLVYPLYILTADLLTVTAILVGRRKFSSKELI